MKHISRQLAFIVLPLLLSCAYSTSYAQKSRNQSLVDSVKKELKTLEFEKIIIQANLYKNRKDYNNALNMYYHALKLNPKSAYVHYELSLIYSAFGKYSESLHAIQSAVKYNPHEDAYRLTLADMYAKLGTYKKQIEQLQILAKKTPRDIELLYSIANIYMQHGQHAKALNIYKTIENQFGIHEELLLSRYKLYVIQSDFQKAKFQLDELLKSYPKQHEYLLLMAGLHVRANHIPQALRIYSFLESDMSNPTDVYIQKAFLYTRLSLTDSLVHVLQSIFSSSYLDANKKHELIQTLVMHPKSNAYPHRFDILQSLQALHPDNEYLQSIIALQSLEGSQQEQSVPYLYLAIKNAQTSASTFRALLELEFRAKHWDSVISVSNKALLLYPNHAEFYLFLGKAQIQISLYTQAVSSLEEGLEISYVPSQNQVFHTFLAEAYMYIQEFSDARVHFEKAMQIDSLSIETLWRYAYMLAFTNSEIEKCKQLLKYSIAQNPAMLELFIVQSILYLHEMQYAQALKILEPFKTQAQSAIYFEHYGDALYVNEFIDDALAAWKHANELGRLIDIERKKVFLQKK